MVLCHGSPRKQAQLPHRVKTVPSLVKTQQNSAWVPWPPRWPLRHCVMGPSESSLAMRIPHQKDNVFSHHLNSTLTHSCLKTVSSHESPGVKTSELPLISPASPPRLVSQVLSSLLLPCLSNLSSFHSWSPQPCAGSNYLLPRPLQWSSNRAPSARLSIVSLATMSAMASESPKGQL